MFSELFGFNLPWQLQVDVGHDNAPELSGIDSLTDTLGFGAGGILLEAFVDLEIDVGIDFSGESPVFFVYDYDESGQNNRIGTYLELGIELSARSGAWL